MIFMCIQDLCAFEIDGHTQKGRYHTRASGIHSFSFYYYGDSNGLGLIFAVKVLGNKVKRHRQLYSLTIRDGSACDRDEMVCKV